MATTTVFQAVNDTFPAKSSGVQQLVAIGNMPADFQSMDAVTISVDGSLAGFGNDASCELDVWIESATGTILASVGGSWLRVQSRSSDGAFTTGNLTFTSVGTGADKATWDGALLRYQQTITGVSMGADAVSYTTTTATAINLTYTPTLAAAVLTTPTETSITDTTATVGCTTDFADGTLYWYISTSAAAPSAADLKSGAGSVDFGSVASPGTGAETFLATGLTEGTTHYTYFVHNNGSDSNILESGSWATLNQPSLSLPTETGIGPNTATVGCTTDTATGTLYWFVSTSASAPSAANLKAGTGAVDFGSQASPGVGTETFAATGLADGTTYYTYFLHTDGVDSAILESGSWATTGIIEASAAVLTVGGTYTLTGVGEAYDIVSATSAAVSFGPIAITGGVGSAYGIADATAAVIPLGGLSALIGTGVAYGGSAADSAVLVFNGMTITGGAGSAYGEPEASAASLLLGDVTLSGTGVGATVRAAATVPVGGTYTVNGVGGIPIGVNAEPLLVLGGFSVTATGSAYGEPEASAASLTFNSMTFAGTGEAFDTVSATGAMVLGGITLSATGEALIGVKSEPVTLIVGGMTLTAAGIALGETKATGVVDLTAFSLGGSGKVSISAAGVLPVSGFNLASIGEAFDTVSGSSSLVLGGISLSGTGSFGSRSTGAGALVFNSLSIAGAGRAAGATFGAGTLSILPMTMAATGSFGITRASTLLSLGPVTMGGAGLNVAPARGTTSMSLGSFAVDGFGRLAIRPGDYTPLAPYFPDTPDKVCGLGGGTGPDPGDPNLADSVLRCRSGYKGIAVSWSYPDINPQNVAHTQLFRSKLDDFSSAGLPKIVTGSYYFDQDGLVEGERYYYWIKIVSIHGTVGELIGPASCVLQPSIEAVIAELEDAINDSKLSQDLRDRIDLITDVSSSLSTEIQQRLLGDDYFNQLLSGYFEKLDAIDTLIVNETMERIEGDDAVVARVDLILAQSNENAAAILKEEAVRAYEGGAIALSVETLQATVNDQSVSIQNYQQVSNTVDDISAEWFVKTDVYGYVSGFGLYSTPEQSTFLVHADYFAVGKPGTGGSTKYPFMIGPVNGETQIVLNARTLIPDAHITNAMISDTIQSDDYDFWTTGWGIHKSFNGGDSLAVFHNIYARGDIEASKIKAGVVRADLIAGGGVSGVDSNARGGLSVAAQSEMYAFRMSPKVPSGQIANIICMVNFQGAAVGESTNVGVRVTRNGSTVHSNAMSAANGLTASGSTSFVAANVGPGTYFDFYLTDNWHKGSVTSGKIQANMMLTFI